MKHIEDDGLYLALGPDRGEVYCGWHRRTSGGSITRWSRMIPAEVKKYDAFLHAETGRTSPCEACAFGFGGGRPDGPLTFEGATA